MHIQTIFILLASSITFQRTFSSAIPISTPDDAIWEAELDSISASDPASLFKGLTPTFDLNQPQYTDVLEEIRRNRTAAFSVSNETINLDDEGTTPHNSLSKRDWKCETSDASPKLDDVLIAVEYLARRNDRHCIQHTPGGSLCHQVMAHGNARIGICGRYRVGLDCVMLATHARYIAEQCKNSDTKKVGGSLWFKGRWGLLTGGLKAKLIVYSG
ncbi:hypothetical protein BJ508DRAFT_379864 [Ascobolus immersus RN42]|uniref:Ecp2 effector protein domain-containing protein n=1 Tax=Ascobolus immersus RN42 TaxID=1160509 RepID=A0A3N4HPQ3_ASCIM|nr:hypothetical protein BJ508DRAFT_379864 [Ascobolus immersus RN42]